MHPPLTRRLILITLFVSGLLLLIALPLLGQWLSHGQLHGLQPDVLAPEFTLSTQPLTDTDTNSSISLLQLRNKPLYLSFGYRHCADTCPTQLATLKQLSTRLGEQVNYVWISLNPEQDQLLPPLHVEQNFPTLIELFPPTAVAASTLLSRYRGHAQRSGNATTNDITHSSYIYLIDTQGIIRVIYQGSQVSADIMENDLRQLQLLSN